MAFLGALPPQQRLTLLLVYGEGFEHEDAARILDVSPETIAARLVRISASLADRLSARAPASAAAIVETLYPEGSEAHHDRTRRRTPGGLCRRATRAQANPRGGKGSRSGRRAGRASRCSETRPCASRGGLRSDPGR
ncbi:RNA polymerase sigma factor [Methyloceanibacter marginalis]|uniref:RNA polymerase sigma factor n=1 Tax=Methyloceanibacter marginalis TaxID=1774971 RepID=UPI003CC7A851